MSLDSYLIRDKRDRHMCQFIEKGTACDLPHRNPKYHLCHPHFLKLTKPTLPIKIQNPGNPPVVHITLPDAAPEIILMADFLETKIASGVLMNYRYIVLIP